MAPPKGGERAVRQKTWADERAMGLQGLQGDRGCAGVRVALERGVHAEADGRDPRALEAC